MKEGGLILYFRHASTEKDYADQVKADVTHRDAGAVLHLKAEPAPVPIITMRNNDLGGSVVERMLQGLAILDHQPRGAERSLRMVDDYATNNVSEKVLRIIMSYTDYVNRVVWHRST